MKGKITYIVEPFSTRTSKAGKQYSAEKVNITLETGEEVTGALCFSELPEGSVVDLEKNESGYWNILSKKDAVANAQHDEIMKYLKDIRARLARLEDGELPIPVVQLKPDQTAPTQATAPAGPQVAKQAWENFKANKPAEDEVFPVDDEPIDLDSIPF